MVVKLKDWVSSNTNVESMRKLNYNMSKTMKYIHKKGYCIKTFNLRQIEILNPETLSPIQYNTLIKPKSNDLERMKQDDIYNLAFMQIGIYSGMLDNLNPKFLKENFQEFEIFLPEDDIPYYRGIITRGARVYYFDYIDEKNKRDINKLQEETSSSNGKNISFQKSKSTAVGRAMVDKKTKELYSSIDKPEAAFVNFLILPIAMVVLGIILSIIALLN